MEKQLKYYVFLIGKTMLCDSDKLTSKLNSFLIINSVFTDKEINWEFITVQTRLFLLKVKTLWVDSNKSSVFTKTQ